MGNCLALILRRTRQEALVETPAATYIGNPDVWNTLYYDQEGVFSNSSLSTIAEEGSDWEADDQKEAATSNSVKDDVPLLQQPSFRQRRPSSRNRQD